MRITYIGHACFKITAKDGSCVITDPYDASVGLSMPRLDANLVTISHGHHDHDCSDMLVGSPRIARGGEPALCTGVSSLGVHSWHDEVQGASRGENWIRIFLSEGLKVVHMGDQGCMPDEAAMEAISDADVMMIPVGGYYTVNAEGAQEIIDRARPRCIIPMHFRTAHGRYNVIADHRPFMAVMGCKEKKPVAALEIAVGSVPHGVVLLQPQADSLC